MRIVLAVGIAVMLCAGCRKFSHKECQAVGKAMSEHQAEFDDCVAEMSFALSELDGSIAFAKEWENDPSMQKTALESIKRNEEGVRAAEEGCEEWAEHVRDAIREAGIGDEDLLKAIKLRKDGEVWTGIIPECMDDYK